MKRIFTYIGILLTGIAALSSCTEVVDPLQDSDGYLTINIASASLETRAAGVDALNENLIETIDWFLYPQGRTGNPAVMSGHFGTSKQTNETIRIPITEAELNSLFIRPNTTCEVYLIVNLPEDISIPDNTSIDNLENIVLANADFTDTQDSFVMTGRDIVNLIDRKAVIAASGNINVERVASKITLNVKVKSTSIDNGVTWTSDPSEITVSFYNGSKKGQLSGNPMALSATDYFNIENRPFNAGQTQDNKTTCTCNPFYSYPEKWVMASKDEPYFLITVPWKSSADGSSTFIPCYYKVILNDEQLVRNTWYDINLDISVLGSFNETEPKVLAEDLTYFVTNWSDAPGVTANIQGARYLVVDEKTYELNNQETLKIPFQTSHVCEIVDMSNNRNLNQGTVTRPNYSAVNATTSNISWGTDWSLKIVGNNIEFKHALNNDLSSRSVDYAPYTIRFRIRHTDMPGDYYEDITITQKPAMIINAMPNRELGNDNYGGSWVNGTRDQYGGLRAMQAGGGFTANPNMYVIETSVLSADSDLIIGDPRSETVNNLSNNGWARARGIENLNGNTRQLENYYPTSLSDETLNMIAPKIRISSSHSVCPTAISFTNAQYRCASYQEDGYPAGRWRLPTLGEVQFIVTLSSYSIIPALFTVGYNITYWYSGGKIEALQNGGSNVTPGTGGEAVVRCVYDEWYWEKSTYSRIPGNDINFAWGDAAR